MHPPLTGSSHDQMVCSEGLPGLPGAHQENGTPASILPGRFAPARRPDQCEGQFGSYPSCHALWGGVCPRAVTRRGNLSRAQAVAPSRCLSDGRDTSGGVCPKAVTRRGGPSRAQVVTPSRSMPEGSDTSDAYAQEKFQMHAKGVGGEEGVPAPSPQRLSGQVVPASVQYRSRQAAIICIAHLGRCGT